jgi:hypothetical protein
MDTGVVASGELLAGVVRTVLTARGLVQPGMSTAMAPENNGM